MSIAAIAVTQCLLPACFAHWCWVPAHLYERQIFLGVTAVIQACCEPVLQSYTEQWGIYFAQGSAALHFCWLTAHLYKDQISIGVMFLYDKLQPL